MLRQPIHRAVAAPAAYDHLPEGRFPASGPVARRLTHGHADAVVRLGKAQREAGRVPAALIRDPATVADLAACIAVIFDALGQSSLPGTTRRTWAFPWLWRDPATRLRLTPPPSHHRTHVAHAG